MSVLTVSHLKLIERNQSLLLKIIMSLLSHFRYSKQKSIFSYASKEQENVLTGKYILSVGINKEITLTEWGHADKEIRHQMKGCLCKQ